MQPTPPTPPHAPTPATPTTAKRGPGGKSCMFWGVVGCGLFLALMLIVMVTVLVVVNTSFRNSEIYRQVWSEVETSPSLQAAIGTPMEAGWWTMGNMSTTGAQGEANMTFSVTGPDGSASIHFEAIRSADVWSLRLLKADVEGGERLDLLDEGGSSLEVVNTFLRLARAGDYAAAHAHFAGALKLEQDLDTFAGLAASNAGLFQVQTVSLQPMAGTQGPRWSGSLVLTNGQTIPAAFELIREGGAWRLIEYNLGSTGE